MLKINNEKARGELIQNPKCQPVLQHFGRGSSGKTGWRHLLYGLTACLSMQSHLSHLLQPNPRDYTVPKMLNLGRLFGTTHLGSEEEHLAAPQLLNPTRVSTPQSLLSSA